MTLRTHAKMLIVRVRDLVQNSFLARHLNAVRLGIRGALLRNQFYSARLFCQATAFAENRRISDFIVSRIKARFPIDSTDSFWTEVVKGLPRYRELLKMDPALTRSILLKAPGEGGERGVLLMYFEYNWMRLFAGLSDSEFRWLDDRFDFIFSTSWSPTDYAALALIMAKSKGPVFVQPCNFKESRKLKDFHPRIAVLDSLPCDWINPDAYDNPIAHRPIDFLMVANWGEFKRHWDFFLALRKLPADLCVVLVGQKEGGRDAEFIRRLAAEIGVPQMLEIHQSLPIDEVAALQAQAKVSLIFSRREGCCVAAVESLFAGCALGMRADAHVGPLAYINERTGLRLRPGHLAEDLQKLLEISSNLDPAAWARENVSCFITHEKLNRQLIESAHDRGLPWTRDLALPQWRPYPRYVKAEDADAMRPVYEDLHSRFPKVFPTYNALFPQ
jgi:glycosyltransferase involved in cell wall biosynthesis